MTHAYILHNHFNKDAPFQHDLRWHSLTLPWKSSQIYNLQKNRSLIQSLFTRVWGKTMNAKKDHIFPQMHLWKYLLIFFEHLQERKAITLLSPVSSSPPKEARCPSTMLENTCLFYTHYFLNGATFYVYSFFVLAQSVSRKTHDFNNLHSSYSNPL